MVKLAKDILKRIQVPSEIEETMDSTTSDAEQEDTGQSESSDMSPEDQLQKYSLTSEFKLFEATHKRIQNLQFLYDALLSIPPSSVEAERSFSSAGTYSCKIRSKLSDKNLSNLLFLKMYFSKLSKK